MDIKELDVNVLVEYENNPRNNDDAVEYVANSIKEFGFKVPIIIDKDNVIIAGHTRLKAAKQLGLETVPCVIADDLTEEQIKAFRLADNKVAEVATWDFNLLTEELGDILEMNMSDFGFVALDELTLDVNDDEFLQDTEITKEKKEKEVICPKCGEVIKV